MYERYRTFTEQMYLDNFNGKFPEAKSEKTDKPIQNKGEEHCQSEKRHSGRLSLKCYKQPLTPALVNVIWMWNNHDTARPA